MVARSSVQCVRTALLVTLVSGVGSAGSLAGEMRFVVHEIDRPGGTYFGQTSLVDLDKDGDIDFISGQREGTVFWYENRAGNWIRHVLGEESATAVGGTAFDVDGDGWIDQVSGGVWFRNPGHPIRAPFQRFETGAIALQTHDNLAADIDGDGRLDLVSLSDAEGVFWYRIPEDPTTHWRAHRIIGPTEPKCHGGIAAGDIDGDGDTDVSRVDRWFENVDGKGGRWTEHRVFDFGKVGPWGIQTRARLVDIDRDGDLDLVQSEGDVVGGRVAWFENQPGSSRPWKRHLIKSDAHKQDFHSICVADFDNDGDLDVFSGGGPISEEERQWFIWENMDGKGRRWKEHRIATGHSTHESVCADVDGDGDIDILTKAWNGDIHLFAENRLIKKK